MNNELRIWKIAYIFLFITFGFLIFILSMFHRVIFDRSLPSFIATNSDLATRGVILSKDGYHIASTNKTYSAALNTNTINKDKKELLIKLFSIYSGIDYKIIEKKINSKKGYVVLSTTIDSKTAKHLKSLSYRFSRMKVFNSYESKELKKTIFQGLDIIENGENRVYNYDDILSPIIGYIKKVEESKRLKIHGIKGVERYYDKFLNNVQNGYIIGKRDRPSHFILDKNLKYIPRHDGVTLVLNIDLNLQKKVEFILDTYKKELDAKEIVCAVMESNSGKLVTLATSNRFNPNLIKTVDIPNLNATVSEYQYEPGSVMKPIMFSALLEKNLINPMDLVKGYNGRYRIGNRIITDEHKNKWMNGEDIIIHSSNIGMAQIIQKLSSVEIINNLKKFGFTKKTGIDLPYEKKGRTIAQKKLVKEINKAVISYGYSMTSTFIQLLRAYNVFNNQGILLTPRIVSYAKYSDSEKHYPKQKSTQAISTLTATKMHKILQKVVLKGTGTGAKIEGLEIGGKTGTAHIVKNGAYVREYNSSFFGFANDKHRRYTIGVTVIEPKNNHFASQTAVPVFKHTVDAMLDRGYLIRIP